MPDNIFATSSAVTTLTLVRNTRMGNNLPSSVTQAPLQNLFVYSLCRPQLLGMLTILVYIVS